MVNKVMLIGRLGKDPEIRTKDDGGSVVNFSLATDESYVNKTTGEKVEKTEWHQISAFGGLAEVCGKYLHKGKLIYVEGKINTRKWQDKDGNDRWSTGIIINQMKMLSGKSEAEETFAGGDADINEDQGLDPDDIPF